jgi:hypothetical protein
MSRRLVAVCLILLATASPALAAGGAPLEPAGLFDRLVAWVSSLWTSAAGPAGGPPAGTGSPDGGCILDPSGGCHGAVAPPVDEED